ncbi:MAG: DNA translocase FtsK, partial [Candidatus Omnitrophica bacterium]|nr:DNA translocase FtsK [Candidatus Omnitrophota bacterium]
MDQIRKNEIIAVVLFAIGVFFFLSIFSFSDEDLSLYTSAPNPVIRNVTGIAGVFLGGGLRFLIGRAAYVIPLLIFIWAFSRLLQVEHKKFYFKFFGTIVLVTAVSASLSMLFGSNRVHAFENGGLVGSVVGDFLLKYLGKIGATVFIIALVMLSLLIATEFLILPILMSLSKFLKKTVVQTKDIVVDKIIKTESTEDSEAGAFEGKGKSSKGEITRKLENIKKQVDAVRKTSLAPLRAEEQKVKAQAAAHSAPAIINSGAPKKVPAFQPKTVKVSSANGATGGEYKLPSMDLLKKPSSSNAREKEDTLKRKAALLESTLLQFDVEAKVVKINTGPVLTMYELEPAIGTKVNKITSLCDNISLAMKSANIRIIAPLPGKGTIGIEVPNDESDLVLLRDLLETELYVNEESPLKFALGKDVSGIPIITDLCKMPHLLIAGATGSGKTVCLNAIICSLLYNATPDQLRFLMVDPKRVELLMFEGLPHLVSPIVTHPKKAAAALEWIVSEMERRYEIFAEKGVRNIAAYKEKANTQDENLPYIVVIVDELADLMVVAQQDVEGAIMRIAQLSRAAGIHLILATQRPSVNVITGVIKANFPARISFKVASKVDSRTVLDANGAEKLL